MTKRLINLGFAPCVAVTLAKRLSENQVAQIADLICCGVCPVAALALKKGETHAFQS